jgi:hypothetical protein
VTLLLLSPVLAAGALHARIDNGLAKTPQMGYVTLLNIDLLIVLTSQVELVQPLLMQP